MTILGDKVRHTMEKFDLLARGDKVVIAVSGGPDSVALLHALAELRPELGLTLHVAHLNHGLRPTADEDATFVGQMAAGLGIPVTIESADVPGLAAGQKRSLEDAGRQARYAFLERVASAVGAQRVATAHTRDDQIESVAMRLLQQAPWEFLAGIPPSRPLGPAAVIRPLLEVTRAEVLRYLHGRSLGWTDDLTNRDLRILRNWVRWKFLPMIDEYHPQARTLLWEAGELAREADKLLSELAEEGLVALGRHVMGGIRLLLEGLRRHPAGLQRRMVRRAIHEVTGTRRPIPLVLEDRVVRLCAAGRPGEEVDLGDCVVRCGYETLEVVLPRPALAEREYRLQVPGEVEAGAFGVMVSAELMDQGARPPVAAGRRDEAYLDATAVGPELRVRPWRPGDRFSPLGLRGRKKVHDLFIDEKVPRWERPRLPLVVDAHDRILWVVGLRIADAARVTERTAGVVRLRVKPLDFAQGRPFDSAQGGPT